MVIDKEIQDYAERFTTPEGALLTELLELTYRERVDRNMLSGFYQGRLLSMMSRMHQPRLVLEIGTYMGYSALCLAEGLAEDGKIVSLDVNEDTNAIARSFWDRSEFAAQIDGILEPALDYIPKMKERIDLVFIDADKENYSNYFDLVLPKMNKGGLIVADNVLWSGDVLKVEDGTAKKTSSKALHEYNVKVDAEPLVDNILLAVRDGLMIARVKD
ncbi:MAG: O-methyltransferase [Pyrinomonadaceae bacterium]|nr:O-methyltransferase [Pyrinomonadaceae bacterium]